MCGIFGYTHVSHQLPGGVVADALKSLLHRGPDHQAHPTRENPMPDPRLLSERFPRSSAYHPDWVVASVSGGANALLMTEWLAEALYWNERRRKARGLAGAEVRGQE